MLGRRRKQSSTSAASPSKDGAAAAVPSLPAASASTSHLPAHISGGSTLSSGGYPYQQESPARGIGTRLTLDEGDGEDGDSGDVYPNPRTRRSSSVSNINLGYGHHHPIVGAGSRSKILHQLGEPVDLTPPQGPSGSPSGTQPAPPPFTRKQSLATSSSFRSLASVSASADSHPSAGTFTAGYQISRFAAGSPFSSSAESASPTMVSPLTTPGSEMPTTGASALASPSSAARRQQHFRKASSSSKLNLSLAGLKDVVSSSPVSTPTHLRSSLTPQGEPSYFSFPSARPLDHQPDFQHSQPRPPVAAALQAAPHTESRSATMTLSPSQQTLHKQRQIVASTFGSGSVSASVSRSASSSFVPGASPERPGAGLSVQTRSSSLQPEKQRSAPPAAQTFKIGLPPVDASPRTVSGSPRQISSGTMDFLSFPSGMVSARSDSFPDLEGIADFTSSNTTGLNIKQSSSKSSLARQSASSGRSGDAGADDGPLEEIVPWLYQDNDGRRPSSPSTISSTRTWTRNPSMAAGHGTPSYNGTSGGSGGGLPGPQGRSSSIGGMLKGSKSTSHMRQFGTRSESTNSFDAPLPPERERKQSGRFMGMLRKKSSAIAVNFTDALSSGAKDRDRSGSNGTLEDISSARNGESNGSHHHAGSSAASTPTSAKGVRPKMAPRSASALDDGRNGRTKKFRKDKKTKENSLPTIPAASAHPGISLDTNLDEMEGIVNLSMNAQHGASGNPYDHINAVTANASNSPRPGTPPSPAQLHAIRRPSLAQSLHNEFSPANIPEQSPLSKRLGLSRRESVDIATTMNKWQANGGLVPLHTPLGVPPFVTPGEAARKGSIASDRRGSEGTINPAPASPDAGWTAPDSWAVKGDEVPREDDSDDDEQLEPDTAGMGSLPATPLLNGDVGGAFANHRGVTRRPGTGGSVLPPAFGQTKALASHTATVRIFKPDNAHTILSVPFNITVAELQQVIVKKPGFISANTKMPLKSYKLYLRSKGTERLMAPLEKPLVWQDRRFRMAGYDPEADKLEELGREDNSYLCKFVLKPETLPQFRAEEEGLEGYEYIDLAGRGIENLPIFLYKHAHEIISLNVSRNPRLHLPTDFVQLCTSMRDIKMVEMGMKRIPQSVRGIVGLTRLDISINRIVELEHCALDQNQELTTLFAHNNRLTFLPDYFVRFHALKFLNISNNRFDTFPVVVCELASLNDLDISFNSLSSLPPEIGKLKSLERLVLLSNNITALPATMSLLTKLRELDVRRNAIQDFAPINSMVNLQTVRAQYNMSKALELKVSTLAHLNLGHNALTRLTVSVGSGVAALTHLDLSNARLETIPDELFAHCVNLQLLVLSDNKIRALGEGLENLQKLARLAINNNALLSLPEALGRLQHLHTLDASNNKLTSIPSSIWLCSELTTLNLTNNTLLEFPDPPQPSNDSQDDSVERKTSSASASRLAPQLAMSLKRLYLAYNRLRDETFRPISLMAGLVYLNLSFNDIYEIPPGMLQKCYQLTSLYLSGNMLTSLPADDLERLINLKVLHLNGNKLQTLPAELGTIKTLQVLDVGSNSLKYNIANWPYDWNWNWNLELRYLNLSGNKRLEIKPSAQAHTELLPNGMPARKRNLSDFSALTKMRVLGLMDVTLMIPSVPDETEDRRVRTSLSSINEMGYGVADSLGASDHLSMIDMVIPRFRGKDDECIIGLFDAGLQDRTGGSRITKFVVDSFVQRLTLELSRLRDEDVSQGLRRTFLSLNRDWGNSVTPEFERGRKESDVLGHGERFQSTQNSGGSNAKASASAIVVYMYKKTLYLANVGDAMAVIAGRTMLARQLTTKHDPCAPEEVARIRSSEGWISPRGLVNDAVPCARAFGCFHAFPAVNCEPAVHVLDLVDSDEFVIIGNRGLWDAMSYQAAVDVVWESKGDPMLAAQKLRDMAIAYGSEMNVMVMVLNVADLFKSKQPKMSRGLVKTSPETDNFYDTKYVTRRVQGSIPGLRISDDAAPQGTVALVFTDIRNSTALWETNPGMQNSMRIHHELLRRLIRAFDGYEVKTEGDAFMVSFSSVTSAVLWCYTVQLELLRADWPVELIMSEEGKELYGPRGELIYRGLSVRMGVHWGAPICEQDPVNHRMDYLGPMVNRAARVSGVAEGGQITASADAVEVLRAMLSTASDSDEDRDNPLVDLNELDAATKRDIAAIRQLGYGITELGEHKLKGLETPEFLSLIYPTALAGRLTGGKSKEVVAPGAAASDAAAAQAGAPRLQPLIDSLDVRSLTNTCMRLEALSAGNSHHLYELPSATSQSNQNSPTIGFPAPAAAPRRRTTLHPHLLTLNNVSPDSSDEQLLVLLELLVVRIENVLSTLQLRQLGPFADVLSALGDATKMDPKYILHGLQTLSQML